MKDLIKNILRILAKLTLLRFSPRIVAITGSVGKTSTKEAIATVLKTKFEVRASVGNYNNEIGVPLTILDEDSGGKNPMLWLWIFIKALFKLFGSYPEVLVLELGTDRPGDIAYLVDLIGRIEVAVLTDIGISHLEFFVRPENLAKEKLSLIKKLSNRSVAVLNFDNAKIYENRDQTKAEILGYGFSDKANVQASDFQLIQVEHEWGSNFKVHHKGTVVPFFLPQALGLPAVYAALAAISVGLRFSINLVEASEALKKYSPPPGRLRLIEGIKHTWIIDDTYNAAPASTKAALEVLNQIAIGRKLVALGAMAELGNQSESGHREVAAKIVECQVAHVFLVGQDTHIIEDELRKRQFSGKVSWFEHSDHARIPIQDVLLENDTILVKGSQSMRMEKIVKEIMADPLHASKLLVRQTRKWV